MDKEKLLKIINTYGVNNQQRKLAEEVFELQESIIIEEDRKKHLKLNCFCIDAIKEEIADVMVMLEQFKLYYGISSEDITKIFWEKVDRQIGRIKESDK